MPNKQRELRVIFWVVAALFLLFLLAPLVLMLCKAFQAGGGLGLSNFRQVLGGYNFWPALGHSFTVSAAAAALTTLLAFLLAYTIHCTNAFPWLKRRILGAALLPMLLPTITYGFAIVYSLGKQGLITRLLGFQPFSIYGFNGLLLGYVVYCLPVCFLLINNGFRTIDRKFSVVSQIMGDSPWRTFTGTILRPLAGTLAAAFVQAFFLSFTDYGIPASVGGKYDVIATTLYNQMLGAIPDFGKGAVVALVMLLPSALSILLLTWLERSNIRYSKISPVEIRRDPLRDCALGGLSSLCLLGLLSLFLVIFLIPFVKEWPYDLSFTLSNIQKMMQTGGLGTVYRNSLLVALCTALLGTVLVYGAALVTARSRLHGLCKRAIDSFVLITNTVPGMVLGLAFLFAFSGTPLQNTFPLIILCNILHYFSSPYLMMKGTLSKLNGSWETTAALMGDSWGKTIRRVVVPNSFSTILEVFEYYFINAMVTISAVIFIAGARTMVITTKIKELQYYARFNEIFVLSLLILFTNLAVKWIVRLLNKKRKTKKGATT